MTQRLHVRNLPRNTDYLSLCDSNSRFCDVLWWYWRSYVEWSPANWYVAVSL